MCTNKHELQIGITNAGGQKGVSCSCRGRDFLTLTVLTVSREYVARWRLFCFVLFLLVSLFLFFLFVKLVFYCAAIDNYYLCFGAVPKVAKIFFKATLGAGNGCFSWMRVIFQQHLRTDSYLYHTSSFVCCKQSKWLGIVLSQKCFPGKP